MERIALLEFRARRMCRRAAWLTFGSAMCHGVLVAYYTFPLPSSARDLDGWMFFLFVLSFVLALSGAIIGQLGPEKLAALPRSFPTERMLGKLAHSYPLILLGLAVLGPFVL